RSSRARSDSMFTPKLLATVPGFVGAGMWSSLRLGLTPSRSLSSAEADSGVTVKLDPGLTPQGIFWRALRALGTARIPIQRAGGPPALRKSTTPSSQKPEVKVNYPEVKVNYPEVKVNYPEVKVNYPEVK